MKKIDLHPNLVLAVTEKEDGNMDERFSPPKVVKANRQKVFKELGLPLDHNIEAEQVHRKLILPLNEENSKMWKNTNITGIDGFITNQDTTPLMIRVADCVPVLLYDPKNTALGMFHAGWRGAVEGIHLDGLRMMNEFFDSEPNNVLAYIGPCAQKDNYISSDKPKQADDEAWQPFITKVKSGWSIDVPGYIVETLNNEGVYKKNMTISTECTIESDNYFSHTQFKEEKQPKAGRFVVIAKIVTGAPPEEVEED